ncbi:MAG: hypothetical protein Q4A28_04695 [Brachymonas sp.]|nr:hypothetical protein [Brachymonas sp.]
MGGADGLCPKRLEHAVSHFNEKGLAYWAKSLFAPVMRWVFTRLSNDGADPYSGKWPCHLCQSEKVQYSKGRFAAFLMQVEARVNVGGTRLKRATPLIDSP